MEESTQRSYPPAIMMLVSFVIAGECARNSPPLKEGKSVVLSALSRRQEIVSIHRAGGRAVVRLRRVSQYSSKGDFLSMMLV